MVCSLAPSLNATSSCNLMMALKIGYGPWKAQPSSSVASVVYSDGVIVIGKRFVLYGVLLNALEKVNHMDSGLA
jgi:hypothetical protein